jgi:hypothetical protein
VLDTALPTEVENRLLRRETPDSGVVGVANKRKQSILLRLVSNGSRTSV